MNGAAAHRDGAIRADVDRLFAIVCFGIACAIGIAGAFVGLDTYGFWFDELFTVWIIEPAGGSGGLFARIATDVHPPIYFVVLDLYSRIVGTGDAALRSFSALSACGAVLIFITATKAAFSLPARLFGGALATGSLFWFFQSQNARSYALCLLISAGILALCLALLADRPRRDSRILLVGLVALMVMGSFVHFYVMYESLAVLIVLALVRRHDRYVMVVVAGALVAASALYVQFVVAPSSQAALGGNWYQNNPTWYYRVLKSCVQYTFGDSGSIAIAICAGALALGRISSRAGPVSRWPLDPTTALLVGVPGLVLIGAIVSSTLLSPNFFDRNFLVASPFLWGISAKLYDAATRDADRLIRLAVNLALSIVVLAMASIATQRLPSERPALLYEPFRESAGWIRSIPKCRGQIVPVITTDRMAWYKPGYADALYAGIYGRYLHGFALPRLLFMQDIVAHRVPADLRVELQRRLDGDGCPLLAWSVHNVSVEAIAVAKRELLKSMDRPVPEMAVKTQEFREGQVGFVLYLDQTSGR